MKTTLKIFALVLILTLFFKTENSKAQTTQTADQLRSCYQNALDEARTEDDDEDNQSTFTIENIQNPDSFFSDCETIDYKIIKDMYVEYYNIDKLTVSTNYYFDYDQYKQQVKNTISKLKIDFVPEDLNEVEQWAPFAKAIQSVYDEYMNRSNPQMISNNFINDIYPLVSQFSKLDDQTFANYVLTYLSYVTENKCHTDCEYIFDFFKNNLALRPEAMKIFLELTSQGYDFIHDNIELGYRYAELKRQASKKTKNSSPNKRVNYDSISQPLNKNTNTNIETICDKIKKIPTSTICSSTLLILNKLNSADLNADEIWKDIDQCQNTVVFKTIHLSQRNKKNAKTNQNGKINLIIQVFNKNTGPIFNENWIIENQDLKNQCPTN